MSKTILHIKRERELTELAEFIALGYIPEVNNIVNLNQILKEENIRCQYARYDHPFDGMLIYRNGNFFIICNLNKLGTKDSPRARFTLAHELGHYFIDEHRNALKRGKNLAHASQCDFASQKLIEQEADLFATNLIIPSSLFQKVAQRKKKKKGLEEILFLSIQFKTSIMSTALRYVKSNIHICAVFIWNIDKSLRWYWKSDDFQKLYIGHVIKDCNLLGRDSATVRAFGSTEIQSGGNTVAAIFGNIKNTDWRNAILHEEALRLGEYGVITFIYPDGKTIRHNDFFN